MKKLTEIQIQNISSKYLSGESISSLASNFGVSKNTIWAHLQNLNVITKREPTFGEKQLLDLAEEVSRGKSIRQVAKEKGVPYATLQTNLKKLNLDLAKNRKSGRKEVLSSEQVIEICSKYTQGLSSVKLGEIYNVSKDTIRKYLKENHVPMNPVGMHKYPDSTDNKLSFSQLENIYLQYKQGTNIESLGKQHNVSSYYLREQFKKNNLLVSNKKLTDKQKKEIVKRYKEGSNSIDLAREYNVSHTLINEILNAKHIGKHRYSSKTIKANKSKLAPEVIQLILKKHYDGISVDLISQETEVPISVISKLVNRRIKTGLTEEEIRDLCQQYQEGQKTSILSEKFNLSLAKIAVLLKSRGIQAVHTNKLTPDQKKEIEALYAQGFRIAYIAKCFNISDTSIRYIINKRKRDV